MRCALHSVAAAASLALLITACSSKSDSSTSDDSLNGQPSSSSLFAPTTKRVVIEIDYERGAAPFVGPTGTFHDTWAIFRDNAKAILGDGKELVVPTQLSDMQALDDIELNQFTRADVLSIAEKHRDEVSNGDTITFYVVFLNGRYRDDDGALLDETVGVSLRGTGVIGMFKPTITSGLEDPTTPAFMEQSTLVHEFGHAVGLVNDGIQSTSSYYDEQNGVHCGNPACIMYWKNTMVKDGVDFVDTYLKPRKNVLFGSECLNDARMYAAQHAKAGSLTVSTK